MGRGKKKPKKQKPSRGKRRSGGATRPEHGIQPDGMPEPVEFLQGSSPLAGMSDAEREEYLRRTGDKFARVFDEAYPRLRDAVARAEPLHLLAMISLSSLHTQGRSGGELEPGAVLQAFYELVHALALMGRDSREPGVFLDGNEIKAIQDLAEEVSTAYHMRNLRDLAGVERGVGSRREFLVQQARTATQITRNWAYPDQMIRYIREMFAPLDDHFTARWGATATGLIDMLQGAIGLVEDRLNRHFAVLMPMWGAASAAEAVQRYYEAFPEMEGSPEAWDEVLGTVPADQTKHMLLSHAGLRLPAVFTLTLDDWIALYPGEADGERLREVLESWSFAFGDLEGTDPEHLFLGNPIWRKPLIRLSEAFFLPHPGLLFSFSLEMMESLAAADPKLNDRYLRRRGSYLEDAVADLFTRAFPQAQAWRGSLWRDEQGKEWENDLLVVADSVAIIVESKAGRVTAQARRGAEKTLARDVEKLVAAPAAQATRFAERLKGSEATLELSTRGKEVHRVDVSKVQVFIPLSITLEHLGTLATNWSLLQTAGFVPADAPYAPTITLGDLEVIFDTLPRPAEKLHYLWRRASFEQRVNLHGDEMDLLAFYLQNGFNIGDEEFNPDFALNIGGLSVRTVDAYYMRRSADHAVPKPRRRMTRWWGDLVDYVESRKPPLWSILGMELLRADEEEQKTFEQGFARVKEAVRRNKTPSGRDPVVALASPPRQQRAAIAGVAYGDATRETRRQLIEAATRAALSTGAPAVVTIGADVDAPVYPCNSLGFSVPMSRRGEPASYFS